MHAWHVLSMTVHCRALHMFLHGPMLGMPECNYYCVVLEHVLRTLMHAARAHMHGYVDDSSMAYWSVCLAFMLHIYGSL